MLNKLEAFIRRYNMVQPGDKVICAVSGGADSVALLFALYLLRDKLGITLEAAHFNHHLRDAESDRDEAFVRSLCDRYDIPLHVGSAWVRPGEKGLEAAAREARYAFLQTLPGKIATAHTADDNAETVLMHLIRGTGLKGLGGIMPVNGRIIRHMLRITRKTVEAFLQEYYVNYIEDSSNHGDDFLRNRIRHHVMPLLLSENPRISENLTDMALRLRLDEGYLSQCADALPISVPQLRQQHPALRSRVVEKFLKAEGLREPEQAHIAAVDGLLFSQRPSAKAHLPGGITVSRSYDALVVLREEPTLEEMELLCPGKVTVPGYCIHVFPAQELVNTADTFTVHVSGKLLLRSRRRGDAIRLPGGTKSVKKLLIDRKIPAAQRDRIPILADDAGLIAVYGIGANLDRTAKSLPAVTIKIENIGG